VLPFVNMSSDPEQEYFSDGISEELLNLLARVPELRVTARTSSFSFKGQNVEVPEIARQLGVAHVLEGSVRRAGDQVRITAQLIHADDGFQLWSQTYDRKFDDIFAIQDEIAADVVKELKVALLGDAPKTQITDSQAFALHMQAAQIGRKITPEALEQSNALHRQALAIDPNYAPAWAGLARNALKMGALGINSTAETTPVVREATQRALAIDPNYAPAYSCRAALASLESDPAAAARNLERALELDPTNLEILGDAVLLLIDLGRGEEALALQTTIVRRDPVNVRALSNLFLLQNWTGDCKTAIATAKNVFRLDPQRSYLHANLGMTMVLCGDPEGGLAEMQQEQTRVMQLLTLPVAYHALGRKAESDRYLAECIEEFADEVAYNIAAIYAYRGEADEAFAWLDREFERNGPGVFQELLLDTLFDNIHSDPRWLPFLLKVGRAPEQLERIEFHVPLLAG